MSIAAALLLAAAPPAVFSGVPNVRIYSYDVEGTTAEAIRASLDARRPIDPTDGQAVDALTRWSISWRWLGGPGDPCGLSRATVSFAAGVQLPRLRGHVAPDLRARWDRYVDALARHEARHVRDAWAGRLEVRRALRVATCATASAAGEAALAIIRARNQELDRITDHGRADGVVFP